MSHHSYNGEESCSSKEFKLVVVQEKKNQVNTLGGVFVLVNWQQLWYQTKTESGEGKEWNIYPFCGWSSLVISATCRLMKRKGDSMWVIVPHSRHEVILVWPHHHAGMGSITHDETNYNYFHMLSYQLQLHLNFLRLITIILRLNQLQLLWKCEMHIYGL